MLWTTLKENRMKTLNFIASALILSILFYSCDKNEFAPEISDQVFTVSESSPAGTQVGTVIASDGDVGQTLSYEIVDGNDGNVFEIHSSTGMLSIKDQTNLDYETTFQYILNVVVSDNHKNEPLESSADILIEITDANEFAPSIPPEIETQVYTVMENSPAGTILGTIEATDDDNSQTITYSIKSGNEEEIFTIDPQSGTISVDNPAKLDYEFATQFTLIIAARDDHPNNPKESTASIQVEVLDENEFAPMIEPQVFALDENPTKGQVIGQIIATDQDTHQSLTYSITGGNEANYIQIDSQTGSLSVANPAGFDYENLQQLSIHIEVEDDHINSKNYSAIITINIDDVLEITDGLLAYYPFNGNSDDESGNGIIGQVFGATLTTDRSDIPNSAYMFDGANDYIRLTNAGSLHFGDSDFSISVWFKFASMEIKPQEIFSVYYSSDAGREIRFGSNASRDSIHFKLYDKGSTEGDLMYLSRYAGWNHITVTKSSSEVKFYMNGILIEQMPVTASILPTFTDALIGAVSKSTTSPDSFFDGKIDDIYIHGRVLEDWEVSNLFQMK